MKSHNAICIHDMNLKSISSIIKMQSFVTSKARLHTKHRRNAFSSLPILSLYESECEFYCGRSDTRMPFCKTLCIDIENSSSNEHSSQSACLHVNTQKFRLKYMSTFLSFMRKICRLYGRFENALRSCKSEMV
jgi:hypothetical protein